MKSDEILILEFQEGSREAFVELYTRYRNTLGGFFRRRIASPARAEELAQDVFLAVIHSRERYEPRAHFKPYLFGIAMNILRAERRKTGRETNGEPDQWSGSSSRPIETTQWVRSALSRLPEADREILMLREYEQLAYDEIAALLHVPLNTVRSRLFRAREELRKMLEAPRPVTRVREA